MGRVVCNNYLSFVISLQFIRFSLIERGMDFKTQWTSNPDQYITSMRGA